MKVHVLVTLCLKFANDEKVIIGLKQVSVKVA
jgi:hypothetical protein